MWLRFLQLLLVLCFVVPTSYAGDAISHHLEIRNGHLQRDSDTVRVSHGDRVKLFWTADRPLELHLHGYDIVAQPSPGSTVVMDINAFATGRFPVTIHAQGAGDHHRAILYLEVIPE